jgi:hypothetical protein
VGATFLLGESIGVDLGVLVDTRLLIQGNSGAGKSYVVRRILEQTFGRLQHLVIDPEGEFSTLREKFDYVLAAPTGGDTVAHPRSAALLCEKLLETRSSAVLDIFDLKPDDRALFVKNFLEALVDAPKKLWHPVFVVLDEAQRFCPERGTGEAVSSDVVQRVATQGRKRGQCLIPAVQRLSMFHKSVAAECNNKLIGRTTLDDDVKRAAKELGISPAEALETLRSLDPRSGEWYAYGPALSQVPRRVIVGPVETTHPKAGSRAAFKPPPPSAAVLALLPQFADLPAEADARAKSMAELQREVTQLRRDLAAAKKAQPVPAPKVEIREVAVLGAEALVTLERLGDAEIGLRAQVEELARSLGELGRSVREATAARAPLALGRFAPPRTPEQRASEQGRPAPRAAVSKSIERRVVAQVEDGERGPLEGGEQKVLDSLAWWASAGVTKPTKIQAGFLAGYRVGKKVGGRYGNLLGSLRARQLIDYPTTDTVELTNAGAILGQLPAEELTTEALQAAIFKRLDECESRVLKVLVDAYPDPLTKQECGARADYTVGDKVGGRFGNILGALRSLDLIDYPTTSMVVALPVLFLENA